MRLIRILPLAFFLFLGFYSVKASRIWNEMQVFLKKNPEFHKMELLQSLPNFKRPDFVKSMPGSAFSTLQNTAIREVLTKAPAYLQFELQDGFQQKLELLLIRQDIYSADAGVISSDRPDLKEAIPQQALFYRGIIQNNPGSFAAITISGNEVMGVLSTPEKGNLVLGKLISQNSVTENEPAHVLYYENELPVNSGFQCGSDALPDSPKNLKNLQFAPDSLFDNACKSVKVFLECDYRMYTDRSSQKNQVTTYISGLFNVVKTLYYNEYITLEISEIFVWTTPDPFLHTDLQSIIFHYTSYRKNNFTGNLAQLVSTYPPQQQGGIAWLGTLCQPYNGQSGPHSFAFVYNSYSVLPTYSWSVEVMTHEMGHNLGSPHTHACQWGPNRNTALDNCQAPEGNLCAPGPTPNGGGTIMSYCHLTGVGINFTKGFGIEPGNLIRSNVENRSCLSYRIIPDIVESLPTPYFEGDTILLKARPLKSLYTYDWFHYDYLMPLPKDSILKPSYSGIYKLAVSDRCTEFSEPDTIIISDFLVNLGCPIIPGQRDSFVVSVTMNADQGVQSDSLFVPDSLFKKVPLWGRDVLVELHMKIEPQGTSWTRDIIAAYQSPPTINISNTRYTPNSSEPATFKGIKTYKRILGKFNPKGTWYFTTNDNKFDNGVDAKVQFSIVISWRSKDSVASCDIPLCDGQSKLFDTQIRNAKYSWSTGDTTKSISATKTGPLSVTVTRGNQTSSHTINLYHYNTEYQQEFTICDGDSISVGTHHYTKCGLYTDSLFSYNACDSIVHTQLNILDNKRSDHLEFICYADSFRNVAYTRDTNLQFHFQAANGCDSIEYVELKVNPALDIEFITTPACPEVGGSLEATVLGGSGQNYIYTWSNGKTEARITGLTSGIYQLNVQDSSGCKFEKEIELKNLDSVKISSLVIDVSCFGKEDGKLFIDFISGASPFLINWSHGPNTKELVDLKAGKYTVFARDANGCQTTSEIEVRSPELLFVQLEIVGSSGQDGRAKTIVNGGTMPYTYFWSTGEKTDSIINLAPGDYWVYVYDQNGCETRLDFTVPVIIRNEDLKKIETLLIYPNPVKNKLHIEILTHTNPDITWRLFDIHTNLISSGNQLHVVTEELTSGVYLLEIHYKNRLYKKIFVK